MKPLAILAPAAAVLVALTHARLACADDPLELELAARVGAASSPGWVANPYALGLGGRAGVTFYGFYGGLSAIYYLGGSFGGSGFHTLLIGLEAGYTFKLPHLRLRPLVGFGEGTFTQEASDGVFNPPMSTSVGNAYVEPGLVLLVPIGRIFVGADANALILPRFTLAPSDPTMTTSAKTYVSVSAHGLVGVVF